MTYDTVIVDSHVMLPSGKIDKNIVIANSVSEMSKAIIYYSENEVEQVSIGKSARKLIESNYDNKVIVANLLAFFKKI